ncbi:unnamed protein product [Paramecium pentaurelia]|uniref:Uncharacterized protein n=1 Tax=Paramecium pentaurelia TaxID=43138 RepID=A0A8S1TU40_9CILI|nr:unnamed protein product [Paramecium pentaurelia]
MRILIVIIISVTLSAFQTNQNNIQDSPRTDLVDKIDVVDQLDLNSQTPFVDQINAQVEQLLKVNEMQQNHSEDLSQYSNKHELIHSVQYWLDKLDNDKLSQEITPQNDLNNLQQSQEQQLNQSDQSTHHSRLAKYIQIQQVEQQQQSETIQENTITKIEETNPLKLLLLYSDNIKQQNDEDDSHQMIITNEQILDQLEKEKQDKIIKMQSLIIEQLKDKKPEPIKEESFLERDYIEWEMKTLTSNNNLRAK